MLQLGRRGLCRLANPYICASCLSTSHPPSFISRQRGIASRHVRLLSTTAIRRDDATPEAPTEAPAETPSAAPSAATDPVEAQAGTKPRKQRKKASQSKKSEDGKKSEEPPGTEAQRQMKILQGALEALKNVLDTQGLDIHQILPQQTATLLGKPTAKAKAKSKTKAEPKSKAKAGSKAKAKAEPESKTEAESELKTETKSELEAEVELAPKEEAPPKTKSKAKSKAKPKTKTRPDEDEDRSPEDGASDAQGEGVEGVEMTDPSIAADAAPKVEKKPKKVNSMGSPKRKAKELARKAAAAKRGAKKAGDSKAVPANLGKPFSAVARKYARKGWGLAVDDEAMPASNMPPEKVSANELTLNPIEAFRPEVPALSYGLDRVLFNAGVYQLQDPRTRVYNFDPYLSKIMPVEDFDFNALKEYVTSSKDTNLISIAKENKKKYTGSTSSMTSTLAHFHYLLSNWRPVNASMLSRGFEPESLQFTKIMKGPAAIFLHWKDGTYAIDADKEFDTANILSMLGKSMEKLLTLSKEDYERYRHGNSDQITAEERNAEEAFHYTGFQDFMMRSQLDAHDHRVPGTGMFDLKTRAVISIRMDAQGYEKGLGYEIRKRFGMWESFEREYFDMIRSAFLKYSLQVRMGRMDGIFVAFHNTQRIFGFQYIPLSEMDLSLHGTEDTRLGDEEFKISLKLLNELLNRATQKWPERSLRMHFETRASATGAPFLYFFAKPTDAEEIAAVQNASRASIEAFERNILGLVRETAKKDAEPPTEAEGEQSAKADEESSAEADNMSDERSDQSAPPPPSQEIDSFTAWQEARQMVEEAMGDDERGVGLVREAIGDALEQSGILRAGSLVESREYVNALLEALMGRAASTEDATAVDLNDESATEDQEVDEYVTEKLQEQLDQSAQPGPSESKADSASASDQGGEAEETPLDVAPEQENTETPSTTAGDSGEVQSGDYHTPLTENAETDLPNTSHSDVGHSAMEEPPASEPEEPEEEVEEDENDEQDDEAEPENDDIEKSSEDAGSPKLEPLKDLIMRMAQRIDERSSTDTDGGNYQDDASKLKDFELILRQLMSRTKAEQLGEASGEAPAGQALAEGNTKAADEPADSAGREEETFAKQPEADEIVEEPELLALNLTIKNRVNGSYKQRVTTLEKDDVWTVEYEIREMAPTRGQKIYAQLKERRRTIFADVEDRDTRWYTMFQGNLDTMTQSGRLYRAQQTQLAEGQPVHVVGAEGPLQWEDVFEKLPQKPQEPQDLTEPAGLTESTESAEPKDS